MMVTPFGIWTNDSAARVVEQLGDPLESAMNVRKADRLMNQGEREPAQPLSKPRLEIRHMHQASNARG
jgi:hypothetical protein